MEVPKTIIKFTTLYLGWQSLFKKRSHRDQKKTGSQLSCVTNTSCSHYVSKSSIIVSVYQMAKKACPKFKALYKYSKRKF